MFSIRPRQGIADELMSPDIFQIINTTCLKKIPFVLLVGFFQCTQFLPSSPSLFLFVSKFFNKLSFLQLTLYVNLSSGVLTTQQNSLLDSVSPNIRYLSMAYQFSKESFFLISVTVTKSSEVIKEYRKACKQMKTKPIENLTRQLQVITHHFKRQQQKMPCPQIITITSFF